MLLGEGLWEFEIHRLVLYMVKATSNPRRFRGLRSRGLQGCGGFGAAKSSYKWQSSAIERTASVWIRDAGINKQVKIIYHISSGSRPWTW